jgi:hypothetical protein
MSDRSRKAARLTALALLPLVLAATLTGGARAADVKALLKTADEYRLASDQVQVDTQIKFFKSGTLDKERLYRVLVKPDRRSLVVSQSPAEKGQKVLMLADDFWIVLPSSQRPIRITPMQKLLGDASAGDIASMTWSEDYDGTVAGDAQIAGKPCLKLDLVSQHKGTTYRRIVLFLSKPAAEPVFAELYVASDKMAKEATFEMGQLEGQRRVVSMSLTDKIQGGRVTEIRYLAQRPRTVPEEYFNPMYLTHNELK